MSTPHEPPQADPLGRPTGVTVFAILHLLFGITGLMIAVSSLAFFFVGGQIDLGTATMGNEQTQPTYRLFTGVMGTFDLCLSAALFAAGFGLLKMRGWARTISLGYGAYTIVAAVVSSLVQYSMLYRPLIEQLAGDAIGPDGASILGIVVAASVAFVGMIYPVAILYYFLRSPIKRKFAA